MSFITNRPTLTADGAWAILEAARRKAAETGALVNISVCDPAGIELAFFRVDGAAQLSIGIARDKAWSVAAFNGKPTSEWMAEIEGEPAVLAGIPHRDRLVIFGGGVPVVVDGQFVGAVGCSGGTVDEDIAVAAAGAAAVA